MAAPDEKRNSGADAKPSRDADCAIRPVKQRSQNTQLGEKNKAAEQKDSEATPWPKRAFHLRIEFAFVECCHRCAT